MKMNQTQLYTKLSYLPSELKSEVNDFNEKQFGDKN